MKNNLTGIVKKLAGPTLLCYTVRFVHLYYSVYLLILLAIVIYIHVHPSPRSLETYRQMAISKRKSLQKSEERFASLKINEFFLNPFDEWKEVPFYKTLLLWSRRWKDNGIPRDEIELDRSLPCKKPCLTHIFKQHDKMTFTWFGQSTCLVTVGELTILTDPVFSKRSINDYLGPKRLRPIPCRLEEFIDRVDIVLVSHDHFDHLDENAVRKLGNTVTWYIPLGLGRWFSKRGITRFVELDWWQKVSHQGTTIVCVPAMHWSGSRTPFEKNNTLWCSFVIKSTKHNFFFCGDTGYSPELFQAIGNMYAPFTLAAIPIGSYLPMELMKHLHMGPTDAIQAHRDLGFPRLSIGIHWGTFMMSDENYLAPKKVLETSWQLTKQEVKERESEFITTAFGETIVL